MNLIAQFQNRDFSSRRMPSLLKFRVNSMRWSVAGGPLEASISVTGSEVSLWEMAEMLRCPVIISDEIDRPAWWGFVSDARVRVGALEIGATIDSMSNAIAVAYSYVTPGTQTVGQRRTTAWATDAASIAEFGRKDFLSSQGGLSAAAATARRDAILASRKYPQGVTSIQGGLNPRGTVRYSGAKKSLSATLLCRGWYSTLSWRMASMASVVGPSYSSTSSTEQAVGSATADEKVVQQITVGAMAVNALQLSVYARKQGTPADNLVLAIYALDGSGNPTGSALATANIAGGDLTTGLAWRTASVTEKELRAGVQYGLQISRSGAASGSNYFVVNVNTGLGYSGGAFKIYNGSDWVARSPNADMPFIVYVNNNVESTQQVRDLVSAYGQFITGVDVEAASGVILPSYRDGDTTALEEISALLASGGANGRRLLASVDINRRLYVYEEPASSTVNYSMNSDGMVLERTRAITPYIPPVGEWVQLVDVVPATVDTSKMIDPTLQFIEGATWSADSPGAAQLAFRGQPSIEDMFKIKR